MVEPVNYSSSKNVIYYYLLVLDLRKRQEKLTHSKSFQNN